MSISSSRLLRFCFVGGGPEPVVVVQRGVRFERRPGVAIGIAVRGGGDAGLEVFAQERIPRRVRQLAAFGARPADRRLRALKDHGVGGVLLEDVADVDHATAVEPHLGDLAVAREHFGQLLAEDLVVGFLLRRVLGAPAAAHRRAPGVVAGIDVDAQREAVLAAGGGQLRQHVALAVFPRGVLDAVFRRVGLPPAEAAGVLGDEEDFLRAPQLGGAAPLVGVELGGIDRGKRRGMVVVLAPLPGAGIEADELNPLLLVPGILLRRGAGQRLRVMRRPLGGGRRFRRSGSRCHEGAKQCQSGKAPGRTTATRVVLTGGVHYLFPTGTEPIRRARIEAPPLRVNFSTAPTFPSTTQ